MSKTQVDTRLLGAGSVLQIVTSQITSTVTIASATPVDTGLTATITPKSTTNKILVRFSGGPSGFYSGSFSQGYGAIVRGATTIASFSQTYVNSPNVQCPWAWEIYDSPASVSAQVYKVQANSSGGTTFVFCSSLITLVLIEIAA